MTRHSISLAVHGGAGRLSKRRTTYPGRRPYEAVLAEALRAGQRELLRGRSAVTAVAAAVQILEDCPLLNAGQGAVLCADGTIELSASVMNGRNLNAGAMVGLGRTKNPVLAAKAFLKHSHGLMFGHQADEYAKKAGLEMVENDYFFTEKRRRQWQNRQANGGPHSTTSDGDDAHGTVGAVARDRRGNLAAATSTGGLINQLPGRVGDSPIVGAERGPTTNVCAVSATGKGDAFARVAFARRLADLLELTNQSTEEATLQALAMSKRLGAKEVASLLTRTDASPARLTVRKCCAGGSPNQTTRWSPYCQTK